jgi:lambda family phage portal protein
MNLIDRTISYFSPALALKRQAARETLNIRSYQGASTGRRIQEWKTNSSSSNSEIAPALVTIRNRARDLQRNNPFAARIIQTIVSNTVGSGVLLSSEDQAFLDLFEVWADSLDCSCDGKTNFYAIQAQVMSALVRDGECLILKQYSKETLNPLQLRVLESDFLDHTKHNPETNLIMGVQLSSTGKIESYYIFNNHPGEKNATSSPVDASEVIHVFNQDRPGQQRGISWLSPIIIALKKINDYADATIERALVSNLFVGIIEDPNADSISTDSSSLSLEPGAILTLPPSKTMTFSTPPSADNSQQFLTYMLRSVSTALCVPYELLSGDLSSVNFSTARMSQNEFGRCIDSWRWNLIIPLCLNEIVKWFYESSVLAGLYNSDTMPKVDFTPPRRVSVDMVRENPVIIQSIQAGLTSLSEVIRENGGNPRKMLTEYASDMALLDELGIHLSVDMRKNADVQKAEASQQTAEAATLVAESNVQNP